WLNARPRSSAFTAARPRESGTQESFGKNKPDSRLRGNERRRTQARDQPGRYSPVRGSALSVGIVLRSTGSARARSVSRSALTRLTSRRHQRRITAVPTNPKAKAKTGIVISVRLPPPRVVYPKTGGALKPVAGP